ncbi:DUF1822 family protein [Geminocystis sp.]|uniref:DUF1822 family protein n=1 Tax=Geminocystis sp. TaxID=2664100 RepID=UPI00359325DD
MNYLNFIDTNIDETKIKLNDDIKNETWQQISKLNNEVASFRGYLNLLVRKTFLIWLNLMLESNFVDNLKLEDNLSIWNFINGNAIDINDSRIVLIPTEIQDKTEFSIPEEWLKIPQWVGNYYLPVEVNLEENYLNFWGYASYEDIINYGKLDSFNHYIDFPFECLENDLNIICLEYEYGWNSIPQISPLPFNASIEESLITEIQNNLSPRLLLNFSDWLSFISNNSIRNQLFLSLQYVNLNQWLNHQFSSAIIKSWQTIEDLKQQYFIPDFSFNLALAYRSFSLTDSLLILENNINNTEVNNILKSIINLDGNIDNKEEIINILPQFINNHDDEETRWNAALALQILDSSHPSCAIWRGKIINLENHSLGLLLGILPKTNNQIDIFIRIYSINIDTYLPKNLLCQIIDENNNIFAEIITENHDKIIQYKFWGSQEEKFAIKVIINDSYIQENFLI